MKNQENNIDKIFNDSLQHYERQPRTEAWVKLQARLKKRDSKILPLWWKYAFAASVSLLLGVSGYWFVNNSSNDNSTVATTNKIKTQPIVKANPEILNETKQQENVIAETGDLKQKTFRASSVAGVHTFPQVRKQNELKDSNKFVSVTGVHLDSQGGKQNDLGNPNSPIITLETIKIKTPLQYNTIVLVLENTKPKKEEETIILNFVDTKIETVAQNIEPEKKQSRVGKIWEQLKRAKNGENVNWSEVGVKPKKVLARADAKIENALTRWESNDN